MRHLGEHACAVACFPIAADGASMHQVLENAYAVGYNVVTAASVDMRDKPDAAAIVLEERIIQAFLRHCFLAGMDSEHLVA